VGQHGEPGAIVVVLDGAVARAAIPALCARLRAALEGSPGAGVICDAGRVAPADVAAVEALLRLQLTARRHGRPFAVRHATAELRALLALLGLADVVPLAPD
jgi:ABC-type transporter Mla MlaB component